MAPMHELPKKGTMHLWLWGKAQYEAFKKAEEALVFSHVLTHYDPDQHACGIVMHLNMEWVQYYLTKGKMVPQNQ